MSDKMLAVHFLQADMRPRKGTEEPCKVGETRTIKGELRLCERGYHYSPTWASALLGGYLYGPIACVVEVELGGPSDEYKGVSRSRKLIKAVNVEKEMRLFAADEAARGLRLVEKRTGTKADPRSWAAVKAARAHAAGKITDAQLAAAWAAARDAAWDAAREGFAKRIGDAVGYWDVER